MAAGDLRGTLSLTGASVGTSNALTGSVVVSINDLVFVCFGQQTNLTASGVTDNLGNSYTAQNAGTDAGATTGRAFWARVTTAGTLTTVTVAASSSTNDFAGLAAVIAGPITSSPVDANPANASDITSPFTAPATGTLAQAREIIMTWATPDGNAAWTATSPNLKAGQVASSTNIQSIIGYQVVNSTSSVAPAWTGTAPTVDTMGTQSFKIDTSDPASVVRERSVDLPPRGPDYSATFSAWAWSVLPLITPPIPFTARAPHFSTALRPTVVSVDYPPNLLLRQVTPAPFGQDDWPLPRDYIRVIPSTTSPNIVLLQPKPIPFSQDDWPLPKGPQVAVPDVAPQSNIALTQPPPPPANNLPRAVLYAYRNDLIWYRDWSQNLVIRQTFAAPFSQDDWPLWRDYQRVTPSWTVSYNLNLIGQDKLPAGGRIANEVPQSREFHIQLRNWLQTVNLSLIAGPKPFAQTDWPVPRDFDRLLPVFAAFYNPNLIGKDKLPVGGVISDLPPQPALSAIQLRSWIQSVNLALTVPPGPKPFAQYDWPNPQPVLWDRGLGLNLLQGTLTPIPPNLEPRAPLYAYRNDLTWFREWTQTLVLRLPVAAKPFSQTDWPTPKDYLRVTPSWATYYNPNLIGKDAFPPGEISTTLPPTGYEFHVQFRTWTQSPKPVAVTVTSIFRTPHFSDPVQPDRAMSLNTWTSQFRPPVVTVKPFLQTDWPINLGPQQPDRSSTFSFNRNLIGQDNLPFRNYWEVPRDYDRIKPALFWSQGPRPVTVVIQFPFNQDDWPLTPAPAPINPSYTFSFNPNLISQDKLPFRNQWEILRDYDRSIQLRTWIGQVQPPPTAAVTFTFRTPHFSTPRALPQPGQFWAQGPRPVTVFIQPPLNQRDWPLPPAWMVPQVDHGWLNTSNASTLPPTPPPPLPPGPPTPIVRDYWDRDEWGRFFPGAGIRAATGGPQPTPNVTKPWGVPN